jgi:hypothetical protein
MKQRLFDNLLGELVLSVFGLVQGAMVIPK